MQVDGATLKIKRDLWAQYDGVDAVTKGDEIWLTGREEDAWLKVFNAFGRLLKLYTFEHGAWVDADSGGPPLPFDESQAGHLPGAPPVKTPAKKPPEKVGTPSAKKAAPKKVAAKKAAATKPAAGKKAAAPKTGTKKSGGKQA